MLPKAPAWFVRKLREINSHLGVRALPDSRAWEIFRMMPRIKYMGVWNGMTIHKAYERREKVLHTPGLGSRVLQDVRQLRTERFAGLRGYEKFCEEFGVRYA